MDDIILIKDLDFKYNDKEIFNKFNLKVKRGSWLTIIGPNGSGKSTLIKIILGLLPSDSYLNIDKFILCKDNIKNIRKIIGVVFENPDNQFVAETVMDEMAFTLENLHYSKKEIKKRILEVAKYLDINYLLDKEPHSLNGGQKQLVALGSALVLEPKILIFDEAFTMIDPIEKDNMMKLLKQLNKDKNITIINITHDTEECLYGDEIVVLDRGNLILKGPKSLVLKEEKIFNDLGLELPFMASLSIKLQYYNLVDDLVFDMNEMVNKIWK